MDRSVSNKEKNQCCGCTACETVCPKKAISMQADVLGFLYPVVDAQACINCGLCNRVCSFHPQHNIDSIFSEPVPYAARLKSREQLLESQSGGAFVALSDKVLERGGVVYGAGYADHFRVVHQRATSVEERDVLRKSKYVQSDMNGVFAMVKTDLQDGRLVLFSGTACQCAGLRSFIGPKLSNNLILVDIICHGVPAPYVWRDYLLWLEKKYKGNITEALFRDKRKFGWRYHPKSESYKIKGSWFHSDSYTYLFYDHIMLRECCYVCPYTNIHHPSDVTIADMWGLPENYHEMVADNKGCSCILVNSSKGEQLFNDCRDNLDVLKLQLGSFHQTNLSVASWRNAGREGFERDYARNGFEYVLHKYGNVGWSYRLRQLRAKYRSLNLICRAFRKLKSFVCR